MGIKSNVIWPLAWIIGRKVSRNSANAVEYQNRVFDRLMAGVSNTTFGRAHGLEPKISYEEFKKRVPIRDYEALRVYLDRVIKGERDVLWPGCPKYFAKTSGTTSGVKYIPITGESAPNHFGSARDAVFNYYARTGKGSWIDGWLIFLSGSPKLSYTNGVLTGRLSGISNHMVPAWLRRSQLPSYEVNTIEDWDEKLDGIVSETIDRDMRLISGIPPWVQMYFERLLEASGKNTILELFPNFSVMVYGGVNYGPYRGAMERLIGGKIDEVEVYAASEGFIAYSDNVGEKGMLLNVNSGIFFEFVRADDFFNENPERVSLVEIEMGVNYALILNNNAGLWGYSIGDTVEFVSLNPPRIIVTGRIKHFISAFGEHVIGKEVDAAMKSVAEKLGIGIVEFTVAPYIGDGGMSYHEWFVELDDKMDHLADFASMLDKAMVEQNIYYKDLIRGGILKSLKVRILEKGAFREYMRTQGKLGGQNKVPRLSNDRKVAASLEKLGLIIS